MTYNSIIMARLSVACLESTHSWAKVSACIVKGNNPIVIGTNRQKTHPFQKKYSKNKESIYLHAETQAIVHALRFLSVDDLLKSELYVCRMRNIDGKMVFGMAKPCEGCMKAIVEFGIPKVYFTTNEGTIEKL